MPSTPRPLLRGRLCGLWLALGLAGPAAMAQHSPSTGAPDYAERVLAAINGYRLTQGLPALVPAPALGVLAAEHSAAMATRRRPSHDGFAQRVDRTGSELCVENVAQGFRVPEQVLLGWRGVATHHRNLLEPRVRYVGVAYQEGFVTYFACDVAQ
ncbi:MAG: CAP domain-containing protein [Burkholderiales bacterium]|nr:CAP domain-containing protein [Burkholderiales bacterium]